MEITDRTNLKPLVAHYGIDGQAAYDLSGDHPWVVFHGFAQVYLWRDASDDEFVFVDVWGHTLLISPVQERIDGSTAPHASPWMHVISCMDCILLDCKHFTSVVSDGVELFAGIDAGGREFMIIYFEERKLSMVLRDPRTKSTQPWSDRASLAVPSGAVLDTNAASRASESNWLRDLKLDGNLNEAEERQRELLREEVASSNSEGHMVAVS